MGGVSKKEKEITMDDVMSGNVEQPYVDPSGMTQSMNQAMSSTDDNTINDTSTNNGYTLTPGDRAMNLFAPLFGGPFAALQNSKMAGFRAMNNAGKGEKKADSTAVVEVSDSTTTPDETPPKKVLSGETNILSNQKPIAGNLYENSRESINPSNSFTSNMNSMGGDISKQKADMEAMFKSSNNKTTSSKTRGGLFGNYGKKVEIRKTFDESTGRTNKQKFIDGELASDRNARQDVRRKGRSSDARAKRKAGRNK